MEKTTEQIDWKEPVNEESAVEMELTKAIRLIHPHTTREEIWKHKDYGNKDKMIDAIEKACEMVCDAARKQVAMEIKEVMQYKDAKCINWLCPACGRFHRNEYEKNYCSECGQRLE